MIRSRFLRVSRAVLLGSTVLAAAAFADNAPSAPAAPAIRVSAGTIVGLVTNSAKLPVGGATVTAARVDGNGIRATVSSSDGIYSFADLAPGAWSVTVQVDGYPDVVVPSLEVAGSKATRHDIVMAMPAVLPAAPALAAAQKPAAQADPAARAKSSTQTESPWSALVARIKPAAPAVPTVPEGLQAPEPGPEVDTQTPFANVGD
ncbi:MAG TPA: carboxypeptidase-like regulatory domain-containing protein, partial [Steroidobacteraceae bacterium]